MVVPVVAIIGASGVGKTTLLERLIPELRRRGYQVGTLKHDAHDFEIDHPGKDSFRHFHAGASSSGIVSKRKLAVVKRLNRPTDPPDIIETFYGDVDIVLGEGFKRSNVPKIEVARRAIGRRLICRARRDRLVAIVADFVPTSRPGIPVFAPKDTKQIADFLESNFMKKRCGRNKTVPRVSLVVDGKNVPLNPFVESIIASTVLGLTSVLRGVKNPRTIRVTVAR